MKSNSLLNEMAIGAGAGLLAVFPMTAAMLAIQRLLPRQQQSKMEPRKISDQFLHISRLGKHVNGEDERKGLALASHFAYGAGVGAAYPVVKKYLPVPRECSGPLYGLAVWAASYAGWLPAAGILPPPQRRPLGRNLLLIAAHLVWGASIAPTSRFISTCVLDRTGDGA